jgi:uncharacterized membrane protein YeaQ/YmgE (transglycosylase-associated protein family)
MLSVVTRLRACRLLDWHTFCLKPLRLVLTKGQSRQEELNVSIIAWIVVGLIAGWLAGMAMGGHGFGVLGNIIVGILGAVIGGFVAGLIFPGTDFTTGFNVATIITAFIGAVVLLLILRAIPGRQPFER